MALAAGVRGFAALAGNEALCGGVHAGEAPAAGAAVFADASGRARLNRRSSGSCGELFDSHNKWKCGR